MVEHFTVLNHVGFRLRPFAFGAAEPSPSGTDKMGKLQSSMAQQIARAACDFQRQTKGHLPQSATVVLSDDTLVITLHGALSPAERALAQNPTGAAQVQNFYRQLFATASDSLRQEIQRITGVEVLDAAAELQSATGRLFASGIVVQIFLLAGRLPADGWSGTTGEEMPAQDPT